METSDSFASQDVLEEISLDEVRELERKRMQEEGDQEEDTTDDSSYKLGPDDNNSNEFDERRVESGGGEGVERSEGGVQGGEAST
ncbi:hypothetical protein CDL15_Pgr024888 [Punica granatum]|uniref:Uncharacterized protein n=1 Tax=Punica granatum TaxID=22663 RepID=A0A218W920_PUNGR|nr:hypothetical protein CDL15_Pgr024888 [Punica granatum]